MPLIPDQINLLLENHEISEDALYYLATKIQSDYYSKRSFEKVRTWMSNPESVKSSFSNYKTGYGTPIRRLAPDFSRLRRINWEKVVLSRQSSRDFENKPITFTDLSTLLMLSCGLKEKGKWIRKPKARDHWPRRALPSGGALYPLEYYILANNVKGLTQGLYHYDIYGGGLARVKLKKDIPNLGEILLQQKLFGSPSVVFFVTAIFERSRVKYGPRALRYILLEAGGVGVQMNLLANALGLDFCFDGGGYDDKIENLIGVDGRREGLVSIWMLGQKSN